MLLEKIKVVLCAICCTCFLAYCIEHMPEDEKLYSYKVKGEYWKSKDSYELFKRLESKENQYLKIGEELSNDSIEDEAIKMYELSEKFRLQKAKVEQANKLHK